MTSLKLFLIKLRSLFFGTYWYLRLFPSFKKEMLTLKVSQLKATRIDLWTTQVLFFTGVSQKKSVFIKLYLDKNKNQREARILEHINTIGSNTSLLDIIKDDINTNGYYVIAYTIEAVPLESLLTKISSKMCLELLKQFIFILEDFKKTNLVHCDITPSNILLSNTGALTIIDFEYSVCKHTESFSDLSFEDKNILHSLGGKYSAPGLVWDDATSFVKIAKTIIKQNQFTESELSQIVEQLKILESKVGNNQYKY